MRFVTKLADEFKETFIRNGQQTPNDDFQDQCARILNKSLNSGSEFSVIPAGSDNGNRLNRATDTNSYGPILSVAKNSMSVEAYHTAMEQTAAAKMDDFLKKENSGPVVLTSPGNVPNFADKRAVFVDIQPVKKAESAVDQQPSTPEKFSNTANQVTGTIVARRDAIKHHLEELQKIAATEGPDRDAARATIEALKTSSFAANDKT